MLSVSHAIPWIHHEDTKINKINIYDDFTREKDYKDEGERKTEHTEQYKDKKDAIGTNKHADKDIDSKNRSEGNENKHIDKITNLTDKKCFKDNQSTTTSHHKDPELKKYSSCEEFMNKSDSFVLSNGFNETSKKRTNAVGKSDRINKIVKIRLRDNQNYETVRNDEHNNFKSKETQNEERENIAVKFETDRFKTKAKWRLNSSIQAISMVTLVILNMTSQGDAAEVVWTNSLASFFGYDSTCSVGGEVLACTLSFTCWLRGGVATRGCGGWLFACCQPPHTTDENMIATSDWKYKVSPPRLRQVPLRNVMPNNVFRRRVDEDVTPQIECGLPSSRILQKRIIGGREARFAEFPWQAHVRISEFQCGGVLVSRWYVATAAHCVSRAHIRDISVWLGALDTSAGSQTARKVGVVKKILHPLFQFRMTQPDRYDIALLKLSRPITFTRYIRAICLPDAEMELRGRTAVIAGWGKTDATDTHTGTNMLRSATVPILSKEQCITWHRSKQIFVEIHSEMICAGHSDGHQDACLGDSGGPLIVLESGRYYLVGITSAGFGCGVDHQPGIYHNVLLTAHWIRGVMAPTINYVQM